MLGIINKKRIATEWLFIALTVISLIIGIWHAYPMTDIVDDEIHFAGGVLRAMENRTILPVDIPYGIFMFLLSYLLMVPVLIVLFIANGFDALKLKLFLVQFPVYIYIGCRER